LVWDDVELVVLATTKTRLFRFFIRLSQASFLTGLLCLYVLINDALPDMARASGSSLMLQSSLRLVVESVNKFVGKFF
jgi:hypothetical protein